MKVIDIEYFKIRKHFFLQVVTEGLFGTMFRSPIPAHQVHCCLQYLLKDQETMIPSVFSLVSFNFMEAEEYWLFTNYILRLPL